MATHAPDWPAKPFSIGLKPVDPENFLLIDSLLESYAEAKSDLYLDRFSDVVMAQSDTLDAQAEAAALIERNLRRNHAARYRWTDTGPVLPAVNASALARSAASPLGRIALAVQDDLVLMRRDKAGWRLVAASLCFPSSWNLAEKFGKPLTAIHGPVPLPDRMPERIDRIFDNLQPALPVWRGNWSLEPDGDLRQDRLENHRDGNRKDLSGPIWLRTEYQTLHKLPESRDILFTIRIAATPLRQEADSAAGHGRIAALREQLERMDAREREYKGVGEAAPRILRWMAQLENLANA